MKKLTTALIAFLLSQTSSAKSPLSKLYGSWDLVEHGYFENEIFHPSGENLSGKLVYSPNNEMIVLITYDKDGKRETISYAGDLLLEDGNIVHHVKIAHHPKRVGRKEIRSYRLTKNQLILQASGKKRSYQITWKRSSP